MFTHCIRSIKRGLIKTKSTTKPVSKIEQQRNIVKIDFSSWSRSLRNVLSRVEGPFFITVFFTTCLEYENQFFSFYDKKKRQLFAQTTVEKILLMRLHNNEFATTFNICRLKYEIINSFFFIFLFQYYICANVEKYLFAISKNAILDDKDY